MRLRFIPSQVRMVRKPGERLYVRQRIRQIGKTLYFSPPNQTFDEFLAYHVLRTLGADWHKHQKRKPPGQRHVVYDWLESLGDQSKAPPEMSHDTPTGIQHSGKPHAWTSALLLLGWDIVCLEHVSKIPESLLARLRDFRTFQAARYELSVAGILARAGFGISFPDEAASDRRRPDVLATPQGWSRPMGVEAKTRVRVGVLHGKDGGDASDTDWIRRKLDEATKQNPDRLPLVIFLDLNSPLEADLNALDEGMRREQKLLPRAFSAVALTNFAYHYGPPRGAPPSSWSVFWSPPKTTVQPPGDEVYLPLVEALHAHGKDLPKELGSSEAR